MLLLAACTPDRTFSGDSPPQPTPQPGPATLLVNELVVGGSAQTNEFGTKEDWLELYNPSTLPLTLAPNEWYVTDDSTQRTQYALPGGLVVPAGGFLVIWCDSRNTVATQIHTDFNLSRGGGDAGLYRRVSGQVQKVDLYRYVNQPIDGASYGRTPDGGPTWRVFTTPTQGAPNR